MVSCDTPAFSAITFLVSICSAEFCLTESVGFLSWLSPQSMVLALMPVLHGRMAVGFCGQEGAMGHLSWYEWPEISGSDIFLRTGVTLTGNRPSDAFLPPA